MISKFTKDLLSFIKNKEVIHSYFIQHDYYVIKDDLMLKFNFGSVKSYIGYNGSGLHSYSYDSEIEHIFNFFEKYLIHWYLKYRCVEETESEFTGRKKTESEELSFNQFIGRKDTIKSKRKDKINKLGIK